MAVCAYCKHEIKKNGHQGEKYNGNGLTSHGYCIECIRKHMPEYADRIIKEIKKELGGDYMYMYEGNELTQEELYQIQEDLDQYRDA